MVMNRQGSTRSAGKNRGRWLVWLAWLVALGMLFGSVLFGAVIMYFNTQLPDFRMISEYKPALITKIYDRNGAIIAEYANERRVWVPINEIPKPVVQAFLSAEDSHFYEHGGYDLKAIIRATLVNALTHRTQGASTITQQVAKTYLLSNERTYTRKIKELILSWRIEHAFTKNEILELYLNRIYLGNGAYGVAAAAETYFSKSLAELNTQELAMIAGMPQAPTRYNPVKNPKSATARRNIVIGRMRDEGYITADQAKTAQATPLGLRVSTLKQGEDAPHFAEFIRRMIADQYGEDALYNDGLNVYTTLDLKLQREAEDAVYDGLRAFDHRHGWRGPMEHFKTLDNWEEQLQPVMDAYAHSEKIGVPAVVLKVSADVARVGFAGGAQGTVAASTAKWTGRKAMSSLVKVGDVVVVKPTGSDGKDGTHQYSLEQIPAVQGALLALDVQSGEVLAMVGGLGEGVGFNRAIQAHRQVGSSFKPFIYAAALEHGYTPATTVLDAPVVFRMGDKEWKPQNYDESIGGLTPMRVGLEKSRNLLTVRLAQDVGMRNVSDLCRRLGITNVPVTDLSVALGSVDESLIDMVAAYSTFPRGGEYVRPTYLRRVQDAQGVTLYRAHPACEECLAQLGAKESVPPPAPKVPASSAMSPQVAYQMVSLMQGVVQRGTGYALNALGRPMGGKTGTTNDFVDAWFTGYTPSIALGVWVGYDTPKSLGHGETGARAALPIWKDFITAATKDQPVEGFAVPDGIDFVRIDADSGLLPGPTTKRTITEAFIPGTAPSQVTPAYSNDENGSFFGGGTNSEGGGALDNLLKTFGIY
ncbi:MAG: PBP1A family penicillin-binding protein [Proteobacteria bacterium]|nr:PBP1A family penicillin-binding protein [Pseudomonadota bacterium]